MRDCAAFRLVWERHFADPLSWQTRYGCGRNSSHLRRFTRYNNGTVWECGLQHPWCLGHECSEVRWQQQRYSGRQPGHYLKQGQIARRAYRFLFIRFDGSAASPRHDLFQIKSHGRIDLHARQIYRLANSLVAKHVSGKAGRSSCLLGGQ